MYVSRFKSMLLLSVLCLAIATPAMAQEPIPADDGSVQTTKRKAGTNPYPELNQTFDYETFTYTVVNGKKTKEGYPIYAMECHFFGDRQCVGEAGQPLGSIAEVASDMTTVSNKDVLRPDWHCDKICVNSQDIVVGAVSPKMQAWLKRNGVNLAKK